MPAPRTQGEGLLGHVLASGPALELDDWTLRPAALEFVLDEIAGGREQVIECGSGPSTVLIARLLRERGRGTVFALEHDPDWAARTRGLLAAEGLLAHARVIEAPLEADLSGEQGTGWYAGAALAALPGAGVALLLVDGPPGSPDRGLGLSRYPAVPWLVARLRPGATVVLDDADRAGEQRVLERWQAEFGLVFERRDDFAFARLALSSSPARPNITPAPPRPAPATLLAAELRAWNDDRRRLGVLRATSARLRKLAGVEEVARAVGDLDLLRTQVAELQERLGGVQDNVGGLHANDADLFTHVGRVDQTLLNHEERIRRLAELHAVSGWVERAALAREPLISVITPTHGRPEQLRRAIGSVREQSYSNWEQVVIVDGEDERAAAVVADAADERVRCLQVPHGGPAAARNRGLAEARGELIAYLDDDNAMHPGWLKAVVWAFEQRPDADVLYGGWLVDDPGRLRGGEGGALPEYWITPFNRELQRDQALADMSAIAHRADLEEAGFDPELPGYHDWDLMLRLTEDRDPLVLPAISTFYATDAEQRSSAELDHDEVRTLIHAKLARRAQQKP